MDDSLLITVSNLLTGQWEIFLTDPVSENKNEYCLIPKPRPFLYLIIHQEMTTSCSNRWTAITQHWYNAQQRIGHVTVQKNFRIITNIRAECYIYIYIYGYREVPLMKVCSALPWHGYSWFFWPSWHFPSVWRQTVTFSCILLHSSTVRFKLIVKVSYSGYTFIYIKTASIEGSILHLLNNIVCACSIVEIGKSAKFGAVSLKPCLTFRYWKLHITKLKWSILTT